MVYSIEIIRRFYS